MVAGPFLFWVERVLECDASTVSAQDWVADISPRPVCIFHGESDDQLPPDGGERLYDAAGEPKYYWLCDKSGHHDCDADYPEEFEERIAAFLDEYLLGDWCLHKGHRLSSASLKA